MTAAAILLHFSKKRDAQKVAEKSILAMECIKPLKWQKQWLRRTGLIMNRRMKAHVKGLPTYNEWLKAQPKDDIKEFIVDFDH